MRNGIIGRVIKVTRLYRMTKIVHRHSRPDTPMPKQECIRLFKAKSTRYGDRVAEDIYQTCIEKDFIQETKVAPTLNPSYTVKLDYKEGYLFLSPLGWFNQVLKEYNLVVAFLFGGAFVLLIKLVFVSISWLL